MSRWIKLVDALQEYKEMYRKFVNYTPINSVESVTLSKEKTGWKEDQEMVAEEIQWRPILIKDKPCLIGEGLTDGDALYLKGIIGTKNRKEVFLEYCKLYIHKDLKTTVIPLNEEIFKELPDYVKCEIGDCWLDNAGEEFVGVKSVWCHSIHNCILFHNGKVSGEQNQYYAYPMCVIVQLPEDILVNMDNVAYNGSCYERALKISIHEYEIKYKERQKAQKEPARDMMLREISELNTKQLKDLYQYYIMFMKENP